MSISSDGQICFGIPFEEDTQFPWEEYVDEEDVYEGDISLWWDAVGSGELLFTTVNYCSGDYPMIMIALRDTYISAGRGYPADFDPKKFIVSDEQVEQLIKFCKDYDLIGESKPAWYLSSYLG